MKKNKTQKFVIKSFESILVIGYILFEELIWKVFAQPIYQYFKHLVALDALKYLFLSMNRYLLLLVFISILSVTELLGFLSGYLMINGYIVSGLLTYAFKIPIAAFTFWLFDLSKQKLMKFDWIKTCYQFILHWVDVFVHTALHMYIKTQINRWRQKINRLVKLYVGTDGFIASIKKHYAAFKPYLLRLLKK